MRRAAVCLLYVCVAVAVAPRGRAADRSLAAVLAQMDEVSARFKGLTADFVHLHHMEVIHADESDSGTFQFKRPKAKEIRVRMEFLKPEAKTLVSDGATVEIYIPASQSDQRYTFGKRGGLLEMLMAQGFGGSSKDLQRDYAVTVGGPEAINGEPATRLQLIPKSQDMPEFKRIDLWISDKYGYTLQQKFFENGGFQTMTYSNVKLNPEIPDSAFKLDLPKNTKREIVKK